jgi:hypothetical protein
LLVEAQTPLGEWYRRGYDGAMQAYREFTREHRLPEKFVETKLAIIERA